MDSAIRLCQSPLPIAPFIGAATARASRVHLSLNHGSLSVSHCSKRRHLVSRPLHVNCMLDRFSEGSKNEDNGKNIVRGMGKVSLVLACILGAFTLSSEMNPKPNVAYAGHRSPQTAAKHEECERPVFDSSRQLIKKDVRSYGSTRQAYFGQEPDSVWVEDLKFYAMALSRDGDPNEAKRILRNECRKWKGSESSDSLTVALIELLLYQRNYEKASKEMDKLIEEKVGNDKKDEDPQKKVGIDKKDEDPQKKLSRVIDDLFKEQMDLPLREKICLYKAVLDSISNKKEAAAKWLEAFGRANADLKAFPYRKYH